MDRPKDAKALPAARGGAPRVPFTLGGPVVIVAIDDDDFERIPPEVNELHGAVGAPVEYVRASTLANPHLEADFYLRLYVPSHPGCVRLFQTTSLELYEQAPDGAIFRNGRQVWPEAPVATGRPSANVEGELVQGEDAALLFCTLPHVRITVTGPLLVLFRQPRLKNDGDVMPDWLEEARANRPRPERPS